MTQAIDLPLGPPPRRAHYRRNIRNARRAYRTLFALVILVFAGWAALDGFRWYDLAYRTSTVAGKVTGKHTITRPSLNEFRLEYEFATTDGTPITDSAPVPPSLFETSKAGDACTVVYLPENPKIDHWLSDNEPIRTHALYLAVGHGLAALLAAFVLQLIERPLRRDLGLARRGELAVGQLQAIRGPRRKRGLSIVTYTFRTAAGVPIEGSCALPRRLRAIELTPGMPIDILYDPHDPQRHKPRLALDPIEFGDVPKRKPASP